MADFSFTKYIEHAIKVEHGSVEPELPVDVRSEATDNDKNLETEVLVVAHALRSAGVTTDTAIARPVPVLSDVVYEQGWDLTELAPTRDLTRRSWLALNNEGEIYICSPQFDPGSIRHSDLFMGNALKAEGRYFPGKGTVYNNETIHYGLARLVARHIFEVEELDETLLQV